MYASRCCVPFQAPPVIAVQLGALDWMDAPAECKGLDVEDKKTKNITSGRANISLCVGFFFLVVILGSWHIDI